MNMDLENTRRDLIAKRIAAGANTPIGHRCSNLIEQLDAYRTAEGDQLRQKGTIMGYTTKFTGAVKLGRKLTMAEAKELLEIAASDRAEKVTGIDAYFQWVPADTLEHIVWDGNEKFYKYTEQLQWLCDWLHERHISANGELYWSGEETGDTGTIVVLENTVSTKPNTKPSGKDPRPLDLGGLGKMALEQVTTA